MSTPNNEEVLREIVSNAIYRKSFNLLIQNEQLNVLDWSGKVMDVFTRQCEEMRRDAVKTSGAINEKHIEAMIQIQHKNTEIAQLTAELAQAKEALREIVSILGMLISPLPMEKECDHDWKLEALSARCRDVNELEMIVIRDSCCANDDETYIVNAHTIATAISAWLQEGKGDERDSFINR